jgi:TonB family protein
MTAQAAARSDVFDQRDSLSRFFAIAVAMHLSLIGLGVLYSALSHTDRFGALNAGGTVGVQTVDSIPIVHHGAPNPLTNDTPSEVPQQPVTVPKEQVKEQVPPPDAIKLKKKKETKKVKEASERQKFRPFNELEPNQLTSKSAPQVSSPLFTAAPGSGQIGAGKNNTLGDQFASYGAQIQDLLTRNWHTNDLDGRVHNAPVVEITFDLSRDGAVHNVRLVSRSGNLLLDNSVQRAVLETKFPALPPTFKHDSASFDFNFELKR